MGNYENLKQSITEVIRTNGNQEITGAVLQSTLLTIISTVGANATFAGIATPTTNPGTPDGPVFWLASESGTYSNFGSIELQDGLSVLMWNGSWSSQQILSIDDVPTAGSDNLVKSGGVDAIIGTCLKEFPTAQIIDTSILSSLDNCSNNTIYRINCRASDKPNNCPFSQGIVANIGWNKDGVDTILQIAKGYLDDDLYIRMKWNQDWTPFRKYVDVNEKNQEVDFGFIENFAVIGDSYASGEIYVEDTASPIGYVAGDYYNKSWGQILARKYGAKCINMSVGGLTTKTWLTNPKGLPLLNSSDAQELYLCALGHNDMSIGLTYLGTLADIETKADSFYGNYATIIEAIQSKAPNSKIVLLTCAYLYNSVEDAFNEAIKNIANAYNIPYIDIKNDSYYNHNSIYHTGKMYNHPTAPLYAGMAKANARLFNRCVKQYYDYFKTLI